MCPNRKGRGRPWFLIRGNEQRTNNGKACILPLVRYTASWIDCSTISTSGNTATVTSWLTSGYVSFEHRNKNIILHTKGAKFIKFIPENGRFRVKLPLF